MDINPFAVAIARFRLIVAADASLRDQAAEGGPRLDDPPRRPATACCSADTFDRSAEFSERVARQPTSRWADPRSMPVEDPAGAPGVLGQQYHAVVGNPPYITVKDATLNERYRQRYTTCHRQYSLGVPFTERFFDLALAAQDGWPLPATSA